VQLNEALIPIHHNSNAKHLTAQNYCWRGANLLSTDY